MKLHKLFGRKPDVSTAARELRMAGVAKDRALIRANVDAMRARMGMKPARWPNVS